MIMETGWGSHASHIHPFARSDRQPKDNRGFLARFLQIRPDANLEENSPPAARYRLHHSLFVPFAKKNKLHCLNVC